MSTTQTERVGPTKPKPKPAYPDSATWVTKWLCPNLEREIKRTFEWCPQWWDHPEAVQRIEAMWRAWEVLRLNAGTGMSTWWVDHADRHLALLCNPDIGPFGHCHTTHGRDIAPLTTTQVPEDYQHRVTGTASPSAPPIPAAAEDGTPEDRASEGGAHDG
jgi:hypothetical protein